MFDYENNKLYAMKKIHFIELFVVVIGLLSCENINKHNQKSEVCKVEQNANDSLKLADTIDNITAEYVPDSTKNTIVDSIRNAFVYKFKNERLVKGDTVRGQRSVKISDDGERFTCLSEFTIKRNGKTIVEREINNYSISQEGVIKKDWFSPLCESNYSEQIPKKSNEHVLLDMVLASTDSMYQTFRVSNFPIKKINDSVYAISVFHKWISYGKYQLSFDLYEGYVALHQYNISDGSYVYLVSILEGETYNCYPYLYKNGKFTCINLFWGYDHPLEYIWSDSLVNSHIDGQDFYDMSFDINGPNTIRVELMDKRIPNENPDFFLGNYVDYAFDSINGRMVKQGMGWLSE